MTANTGSSPSTSLGGETPLWDFPRARCARGEVATYVVARTLGWPNVPATVCATGRSGWNPSSASCRPIPTSTTSRSPRRFPAEFRRVAAFDLVINNADRKAGHCLLGERADPRRRPRRVLQRRAEAPHGDLGLHRRADRGDRPRGPRRLADDVEGEAAAEELANLLAEPELVALAARARAVSTLDRFPEPGPDRRPFPWPPI